MHPDVVLRCPICRRPILLGEPTAEQRGVLYHLDCFRGKRPKFHIWLTETIRKAGRTTREELYRKALKEGFGITFDHLEYFLQGLVKGGLVKEEGKVLVWAGEEAPEIPLAKLVQKKKLEPRIKPPNIIT
jgi:hypothetical protein